jgi:outer membrane protein TolC
LDFNHVPDVDDLNIRGVATLPIYTGGRIRAGRESAKAATSAAREDAAAVRIALAFEVSRAFHTVLKTRQFINAAESAANAFEKNVEIAKKRLAAGAFLKSDVLDLQVRAAEARENLVLARNANALAIRVLRNLIGIEEGEFSVADEAPAVSVPENLTTSQRPEIGAAKARQRAAEEQVRGAKSGYLPRVSAFGSLDYDYGWKYANGGGSYTAGGLLQWDIWDGHLTRAKVRQAEAGLDSAREEARKTLLGIDLEMERARLDLNSANERLAVTEEAVSHAAESAENTRARFEQGEALATQLIDAETALVGARVRRAEAEADQRIAIGALRKALGSPQLDSK